MYAIRSYYDLSIIIAGRPDLKSGQFELTFQKREKEEPTPEYVEAASVTPPQAQEPPSAEAEEPEDAAPRIISYNVCYTKLLRISFQRRIIVNRGLGFFE